MVSISGSLKFSLDIQGVIKETTKGVIRLKVEILKVAKFYAVEITMISI